MAGPLSAAWEFRKSLLFVNKKMQKNFIRLMRKDRGLSASKSKKFFGSFFQKRTPSFLTGC